MLYWNNNLWSFNLNVREKLKCQYHDPIKNHQGGVIPESLYCSLVINFTHFDSFVSNLNLFLKLLLLKKNENKWKIYVIMRIICFIMKSFLEETF